MRNESFADRVKRSGPDAPPVGVKISRILAQQNFQAVPYRMIDGFLTKRRGESLAIPIHALPPFRDGINSLIVSRGKCTGKNRHRTGGGLQVKMKFFARRQGRIIRVRRRGRNFKHYVCRLVCFAARRRGKQECRQ